jgi:predicted transcriptional regulator
MRTILYSIKPEYMDLILSGNKTVELRKRIPDLQKNDKILLYASSPQKALVGITEVLDFFIEPIEKLWSLVSDTACIDFKTFQNYYLGKDLGVGIVLKKPRKFVNPIPLEDLRNQWFGFSPPQDYRYITLENNQDKPKKTKMNITQPVILETRAQNEYLIRL